jgi:hypothetical protein
VQPWEELFVDELYSPLVPILALAYEHDPDPEMRLYKDGIDAERREKLILGAAAGVTAIYEYFGPERRRIAAEFDGGRSQGEWKIGRNDLAAADRARNTNIAAEKPMSEGGEFRNYLAG